MVVGRLTLVLVAVGGPSREGVQRGEVLCGGIYGEQFPGGGVGEFGDLVQRVLVKGVVVVGLGRGGGGGPGAGHVGDVSVLVEGEGEGFGGADGEAGGRHWSCE